LTGAKGENAAADQPRRLALKDFSL
jgi:hypothetical protein